MTTHRHVQLGERIKESIHIGGVFASSEPAVVHTILGSCVAVCLRDPVTLVGGMNHFMLPRGASDELASARYGIHAMELLINRCMNNGADRRRFEAKVFGGGHVLKMRESDGNVPRINIKFALEFLNTESIPIVSRDLGGYSAREVLFFTDTGRTLVRKLQPTDMAVARKLSDLENEERSNLRTTSEPMVEDNVTLF